MPQAWLQVGRGEGPSGPRWACLPWACLPCPARLCPRGRSLGRALPWAPFLSPLPAFAGRCLAGSPARLLPPLAGAPSLPLSSAPLSPSAGARGASGSFGGSGRRGALKATAPARGAARGAAGGPERAPGPEGEGGQGSGRLVLRYRRGEKESHFPPGSRRRAACLEARSLRLALP